VEEGLPLLVRRILPAVATLYSVGSDLTLGSGFFINDHGTLVTNHHVLEGARIASAKLYDGRLCPIKMVLADDPAADLMKVQVEVGEYRTPFLLLESRSPALGQHVVAIGSPEGLEGTVSEGIVSGVGRDIGGAVAMPMLQITAPISHGSSGGPVLNLSGEVVGVAALINTEGENLNFAVPASRIRSLRTGEPISLTEWSASKRSVDAYKLYLTGLAALERDDCSDGLTYFKQATRAWPDLAEAWWGIGTCSISLGSMDDAEAAYDKALKLNPKFAAAHLGLGAVYLLSGRPSLAELEYDELRSLDPSLASALSSAASTQGYSWR
jgi:hypothetical protein